MTLTELARLADKPRLTTVEGITIALHVAPLLAVAKAAQEVADDLEVDYEAIDRLRAALDALERV